MRPQRVEHLDIYQFKKFKVETLKITSSVLKKNPLGDPYVRRNPVLVPKAEAPNEGHPVVIVLSGFSGSGPKAFGVKSFQLNYPESIDLAVSKGEAPEAIYVFVEAMTFWGGSQFLDSAGCGQYASYVTQEVVKAVKKTYDVSPEANRWCVMGGSSGGYGALQLSSSHPDIFGLAAAVAPDSFFERCYLPDIYAVAPTILKFGGVEAIKKSLAKGEFGMRRDAHTCLLYTSPSPRDRTRSRMPSSA